jgi:hypothetical protein
MCARGQGLKEGQQATQAGSGMLFSSCKAAAASSHPPDRGFSSKVPKRVNRMFVFFQYVNSKGPLISHTLSVPLDDDTTFLSFFYCVYSSFLERPHWAGIWAYYLAQVCVLYYYYTTQKILFSLHCTGHFSSLSFLTGFAV